MMDAAAKVAMRRIQEFTPQAIANTAWAFGALQVRQDELLDLIADEASLRNSEFNDTARRTLTAAGYRE